MRSRNVHSTDARNHAPFGAQVHCGAETILNGLRRSSPGLSTSSKLANQAKAKKNIQANPHKQSPRTMSKNALAGGGSGGGGGDDSAQSSTLRIGRWTQDEHERFSEAYQQYGKKWKKIAHYVGTRSNIQCRTHSQNLKSFSESGSGLVGGEDEGRLGEEEEDGEEDGEEGEENGDFSHRMYLPPLNLLPLSSPRGSYSYPSSPMRHNSGFPLPPLLHQQQLQFQQHQHQQHQFQLEQQKQVQLQLQQQQQQLLAAACNGFVKVNPHMLRPPPSS
ncbi:hypothetical protein BASA81_000427 [Batrachochytrium salamandrivorans]|nr:hypothetical protein BASA81_000427 [Batrachochytrium salamandrivorans]